MALNPPDSRRSFLDRLNSSRRVLKRLRIVLLVWVILFLLYLTCSLIF